MRVVAGAHHIAGEHVVAAFRAEHVAASDATDVNHRPDYGCSVSGFWIIRGKIKALSRLCAKR